MKRIIKRKGLPKVVQVVTSPSDKAGRGHIAKPVSLAGAFGTRPLVRRALRVSNPKDTA